MLQIVHDVAPGAQLFFATADVSEAGFAANILALRDAPYNCDIIIDDVFYFDEPVFQDGIVAQAVNTVTAAGALYFSSAGNEGNLAKGTAGSSRATSTTRGLPLSPGAQGRDDPQLRHRWLARERRHSRDRARRTRSTGPTRPARPRTTTTSSSVSSTGTVMASSTDIQNGAQLSFERFNPPAPRPGRPARRLEDRRGRRARLQHQLGPRDSSPSRRRGRRTATRPPSSVQRRGDPGGAALGPGSPAGPFPGPFGSSNLPSSSRPTARAASSTTRPERRSRPGNFPSERTAAPSARSPTSRRRTASRRRCRRPRA